MVVSWIQNSISSSIKSSVAFVDDAHKIWTDLQDRFSQQNGPRIFQLKKSLAGILQDNDSVSVYYGKLKTLWDELSIYDPIPVCNCATGVVPPPMPPMPLDQQQGQQQPQYQQPPPLQQWMMMPPPQQQLPQQQPLQPQPLPVWAQQPPQVAVPPPQQPQPQMAQVQTQPQQQYAAAQTSP
ncbi:hypothetical protein F0562_010112 [Nyssa sinensis]|uniref:Retrotransposon gag domain-containing protein n=1 Tax=Nyssa sinensis TaxID=561372 RepID=A0A5J5A057_9ASTE|nr:hypothetical protein F0562_010112 [Nyssa sinensis]